MPQSLVVSIPWQGCVDLCQKTPIVQRVMAEENPRPEIAVTPQMIEAGKAELEHSENASEEQLVCAVYASMERARRTVRRRGRGKPKNS